MFGTSVAPCAMRREAKPKRQMRAKGEKRFINPTSRRGILPKALQWLTPVFIKPLPLLSAGSTSRRASRYINVDFRWVLP